MAKNHPAHPPSSSTPWSDDATLDDGGYSRDEFYCGGTDGKGHSEKTWNIKVQPWLKDLMARVANEVPAYKGQIGNLARNALTHQIKHDISRLDDPKLREALMKEFQLHVDMEDQGRHLGRFAEMQRYVSTTRVVLPVYAESGNWMMVSRELEKMRRNVDDGVVWEPCKSELQQLFTEFSEKLRRATS